MWIVNWCKPPPVFAPTSTPKKRGVEYLSGNLLTIVLGGGQFGMSSRRSDCSINMRSYCSLGLTMRGRLLSFIC